MKKIITILMLPLAVFSYGEITDVGDIDSYFATSETPDYTDAGYAETMAAANYETPTGATVSETASSVAEVVDLAAAYPEAWEFRARVADYSPLGLLRDQLPLEEYLQRIQAYLSKTQR